MTHKPIDNGNKSASDRLNAVEDIHKPGGACEVHRKEFWDEIKDLRKFQYMVLGALIILSVLGPIVAEKIMTAAEGQRPARNQILDLKSIPGMAERK